MSFSALGVQYVFSDVIGWSMTVQCSDGCAQYGEPMKPYLLSVFSDGTINSVLTDASTGNYSPEDNSPFDKIINFSTAAAFIGWEVVQLLTGTYVFTFLYFMGVPWIFVTGFATLYAVFLIRGIVGYIRGV